MTAEEEQTHKARNRIAVAESPAPPADLKERLVEFRKRAGADEPQALLRAMRELAPTFRTPEVDPASAMRAEGLIVGSRALPRVPTQLEAVAAAGSRLDEAASMR